MRETKPILPLFQCLFRGNLNKHEGGGMRVGGSIHIYITLFPLEFQSSLVVLVSSKKETV